MKHENDCDTIVIGTIGTVNKGLVQGQEDDYSK